MSVATSMIGSMTPRSGAQDIDRHVGARMRERRIMLGLTQQELAELIGVTYQQAHKYEKGVNRIAAGRLSSIAQALGVPVGYFFDGLTTTPGAVQVSPQQRLMLELTRNFMAISDRRQQEAICNLARSLANRDLGDALDIAAHVRHGQARAQRGRDRRRHGAHGRCREGGAEGGRHGLLELARLHPRHARRHAGGEPHRRMGGDRPHHRGDGRARCRHLPGRAGYRERRPPSRLPRPAAQGGAGLQAADHVRRAGDQAGRRSHGLAIPDQVHRRHRRRRRPHVRPGHDALDQRHLLAEVLPAVRRAAGVEADPRAAAGRAEEASCATPRCAASWSRPRRA